MNEFYVDESRPWFKPESGWPERVPKNPDFPSISLYQMLEESVEKHGDSPLIWFLDTFMTFKEFHRHTLALANGLYKLGVRKGDVVALILPNSFQYVISYYACARIGAVVTGVNPTYKPGEVLHQFKLTGVKTVIALDALCETMLEPILKEYSVQHIITTSVVDLAAMSGLKKWLGKKLKKIPTGPVPSGSIPFTDLLKTDPNPPAVEVSAEDPHTYIMTGGTTGVPKAAVLTHFNCVSNAVQLDLWIWMGGEGFCSIGVLPLFHSFGMSTVMNVSVRSGMWMMLFPRPPKTEELLETVCRVAPDNGTFYCGAEVLFQRIAELPTIDKYPISKKLRCAIAGAGPLHKPVQERFEKVTGAVLVEGYGLSETSPVVCAGPLTDYRTIGYIGIPMPGTDWKIMDMDTGTKEEPIGTSGELWVTGPQVMKSYLNQPTETENTIRVIDGKRWLATGDIGFMDERGLVTINDRKKQLIKVRGWAVFPKEVEELVGHHPMVSEVAAAGLPDPDTGEAIKVWVVLKPEYKGKITEDELRAWCKENMTHYKTPRYVQFQEDLPKTLVGKVMRRELQEADPIFKKHTAP